MNNHNMNGGSAAAGFSGSWDTNLMLLDGVNGVGVGGVNAGSMDNLLAWNNTLGSLDGSLDSDVNFLGR
jgi:hypothetical protein